MTYDFILLPLTVALIVLYIWFDREHPRVLSKEELMTRLAEIASGRCPRCGAMLFVSHTRRYLACENQRDPYNTLRLAGNGQCTRMITSLDILEQAAKRYDVEMPLL